MFTIRNNSFEYYHKGNISSYHGWSTTNGLLDGGFEIKDHVLFLYPRDFTTVCTEELKGIQESEMHKRIPIVAGSTDSPETHAEFMKELKLKYPILTVLPYNFGYDDKRYIFDEFGYARRLTLFFIDGEMIAPPYGTHNDIARDLGEVERLWHELSEIK